MLVNDCECNQSMDQKICQLQKLRSFAFISSCFLLSEVVLPISLFQNAFIVDITAKNQILPPSMHHYTFCLKY